MNTTRLALLTVLAVAATITPTASAATQRYAATTGSGTDCTAVKPCNLREAVENAATGDEVIVAPGDYALTATLETPSGITVRGVAGRQRPHLRFNAGELRVDSSTLRYVEVDQSSGTRALITQWGVVDQVVAKGSAPGAVTANIQTNSLIRNSIVVASGAGGVAIATDTNGGVNTSTYRNVTAIASGANGTAIQARALSPTGRATVNLVNVIARGFVGLKAHTDSTGAEATINVTHTNYIAAIKTGTYATIVDYGGNQLAAPSFANWPKGDYRQAPGSVTIAAGLGDADNGTLDVEGDPRNLGTVDIGADEFVSAPAATTGAADAVTDHSVRLSGSVDGHGGPTSYRFDYGPTTAYGHSTPTAGAGAGAGTGTVTAKLDGLSPATTYHYRLVATNSGGVTKGADRTFTTPPQAAPPPTQTSPPPAPQPPTTSPAPPAQPFAGVELVSRKLTYARRSITVRLRCAAGTVGRCSGRTKVTARRRASARRVTLGRARFFIAAGKRARVRVRVSRSGQRLLGSTRRLRGRAVNAARDGTGRSKTTRAAVTIRRRHR
jgi:hypothetical protein